VYQDLMSNPLIVPVKILSAHKVENFSGVQAIDFHPSQPWIFSSGVDGKAHMFVDV
jgi:ribosome biogenesis protein ERB1